MVREKRRQAATVFTAIDGEGIDNKSHTQHYYNLLVARCRDKNGQLAIRPDDGMYLHTFDILDFLLDLPHYPGSTFVMFYFNYDVTKWLQDLPREDLETLWRTGRVMVASPIGTVYDIRYMPNKIFSINSYDRDKNGKVIDRRYTKIYDTFGFFQSSFVNACSAWGVTEQLEEIERMKKKRGDFANVDADEILQYTLYECDALCELMNRVRDALYKEDIPIKSWHGAGAIAQAILTKYRRKEDIVTPEIRDNSALERAVLGAYFGGRTELFRQGIISRTYQYDINSAYPFAMSQLPSFKNCRIEHSNRYTDDPYSLWFVTYNLLKKKRNDVPLPGPLPYRTKDGSICYPHVNRNGVWVHQCELQNAMRLYGRDLFQIKEGWIFYPRYSERGFDFIDDLVERRLELKRAGDLSNIVLKLGLNSLYGKTAQGQTEAGRFPPFNNYYIAGYITAFTRARLLEYGYKCGIKGSGLIQFATDGIFSTTKIPGLESSSKFGEWEYGVFNGDICYIQPGVYFANKQIKKRRTRGFKASSVDAKTVFREWRKNGPDGKVVAPSQQFIGIGSSIVRRTFSKYGRFIKTDRILSFLPPPTKTYWPIVEPVVGDGVYEMASWYLAGITKQEVNNEKREYCYLVPWPEVFSDAPSFPYTPKKLRENYEMPDYIREMIADEIAFSEQPDPEDFEYVD